MRATRITIALFFFGDGLLLGSWAARIPAVQRHTGLTNAQLGLALFAASVGALVAMPLAGWLSGRIGSRVVTVAALLAAAASLFGASLADGLAGLAAALFGFGAGFGAINVAANAQGLALERLYRRPILSSFHAAFSSGGLAGAGFGALVAGVGIGPRSHFGALAVGLALFALVSRSRLLAPEADAGERTVTLARPPRTLLVLGAAAFCTMLAEGAAADWSAVYLSHSVGAAAAVAALGYTTFSLAMVVSRTVGDPLNVRLGPVSLVRGGGLVAAVGLAAALLAGSTAASLAGFAAMGFGLGVVVPVLFRAAGSTPGVSPGVAVAAVSTIGWFGFLAGPPAIGFAAGAVGLRSALGLVVVATALLALLARGARVERRSRGRTPEAVGQEAHLLDELGRLEHLEVDADRRDVDGEPAEPVGAGAQEARVLVDRLQRAVRRRHPLLDLRERSVEDDPGVVPVARCGDGG
jgi:MFS family permease